MITNYLSPLEFVVTVKRLPHVQFFTQKISVPSLSATAIERPTPFKVLTETGDKLSYGELNLSFIIDEQMNNFIEIVDWMKGINFPESFDQFKKLNESNDGLRSDISLLIMNNKKNPNIEINFIDCFPTNLSEISLDTTATDVMYPEASVSFAYNSYSISKVE